MAANYGKCWKSNTAKKFRKPTVFGQFPELFWWRLLDSNQWPPACEELRLICGREWGRSKPLAYAGLDRVLGTKAVIVQPKLQSITAGHLTQLTIRQHYLTYCHAESIKKLQILNNSHRSKRAVFYQNPYFCKTFDILSIKLCCLSFSQVCWQLPKTSSHISTDVWDNISIQKH